VVIGILLGQGTPERGTLEIRSVNNDRHNTGLQARSNPLTIAVTNPVRASATVSPASVSEGQNFTVSWGSANADRVQVSGPGFPSGAVGLSGSQTVTAGCIGNSDTSSATFQARALRNACSETSAQSATVTINTTRRIDQFDALPGRPFENTNFDLAWNAPGSTGVTITGPNNLSRTDSRSQGRITVTAPAIPANACALFLNFNYQITATFPGSCGSRTTTTPVSAFAAVQTFDLVESGGAGCLSSNHCLAQGRTKNEAIQCARCAIQQGCHWE